MTRTLRTSNRPGSTEMGEHRRRAGAVLLLAVALAANLLQPADAKPRPDLVVRKVSLSSSIVAPGGELRIADRVVNIGKAPARASKLRHHLALGHKRSKADIALSPLRKVARLKPGKSSKGGVTVTVPPSMPVGEYHLISCADVTRVVQESKEGNNCFTSNHIQVRLPSEDGELPPTSLDLIEQEVETGKLDAETGLIYKVFAVAGDKGLPARFRTDVPLVHSSTFSEVAASWHDLSPETQALLGPFLIPPFHSGSYWSGAPALSSGTSQYSRSASSSAPSHPWCARQLAILSAWAYVDAVNGKVRIWWRSGTSTSVHEKKQAEELASILDNGMWVAVVEAMGGRHPKPDGGGNCDGGSPALDIAFLENAKGAETIPTEYIANTSTHILLPTWYVDAGWRGLHPYVAHELMHAIQYGLTPAKGTIQDEYLWLREATAQWVQDYVSAPEYGIGVKPNNTEHDKAAEIFLAHPEVSLDQVSPPNNHHYGAYLFFYFATRKLNDPKIVARAWDNTATMGALEAVDVAVGGIWKIWKDFVRYNWNTAPFDHYKKWDGLGKKAKVHQHFKMDLPDKKQTVEVPIGEIPRLATKYFHYTFPDPKIRWIKFSNEAHTGAGATVQLLIKYADGTWKERDLEWMDFSACREEPGQDVREIVLIVSSASIFDEALIPNHPSTFEVADACVPTGYKGTVSGSTASSSAFGDQAYSETWSGQVEFYLSLDASGLDGGGIWYATKGGSIKYSLTGHDYDCTLSGSGTVTVERDEHSSQLGSRNAILVSNGTAGPGSLYEGGAHSSTGYSYTATCADPDGGPPEIHHNESSLEWLRMEGIHRVTQARSLTGSHQEVWDDANYKSKTTWEWDLKPIYDP